MPYLMLPEDAPSATQTVKPARKPQRTDDDRAPACPVCARRLAILSTQTFRDGNGDLGRRQVWGCPRGHAVAHRVNGLFGSTRVLPRDR